jgi:hypothetical protein
VFIASSIGNFRLQTNSPCIDYGSNNLVKFAPDRDGRPRIVNGKVDLGAYEFQGSSQGEFIQWLYQHRLATDGSEDYSDPDADGFKNWNEWRAGTDPGDANSRLRVISAQANFPGIKLTWESVAAKFYSIQRTTSLAPAPFQPVATHIPGATGTQTYVDSSATNNGPYFYRVSVE